MSYVHIVHREREERKEGRESMYVSRQTGEEPWPLSQQQDFSHSVCVFFLSFIFLGASVCGSICVVDVCV